MFEARGRYQRDIERLLTAIREEASGEYACVLEGTGIVGESRDEGSREGRRLGQALAERTGLILALGDAMAGEGPGEDAFAGLESHGFLVGIVNGKVALVVACREPEAARVSIDRAFQALVDRLFRLEPRWRADRSGRGFFFGRAKVDWVVASPPGPAGAAT